MASCRFLPLHGLVLGPLPPMGSLTQVGKARLRRKQRERAFSPNDIMAEYHKTAGKIGGTRVTPKKINALRQTALKRLKVPKKGRGRPPYVVDVETAREIRANFELGHTYREISEAHGISIYMVKRVCRPVWERWARENKAKSKG